MFASTSKQAAATPPFLPENTANLNASGFRQTAPPPARTSTYGQASLARWRIRVCVLPPLYATLPARGRPRKRRPCTLPAPAPRRCAHRARHVVAEGEDTSRLLGAMARRAVAGHEKGID
jgi:hypothetical protein